MYVVSDADESRKQWNVHDSMQTGEFGSCEYSLLKYRLCSGWLLIKRQQLHSLHQLFSTVIDWDQRFHWWSWCEQRFLRLQVTGHQKLLAAPVMCCLSWLQSASRGLHKETAVPLLSWSSVFREFTSSVGSLRFLFGWDSGLSFWFFFLLASFYTFSFPSVKWLPLLLCHHFDRISGWLCVLFPSPPFRHQGTGSLWPFSWLCSALSVSHPAALQVWFSGET